MPSSSETARTSVISPPVRLNRSITGISTFRPVGATVPSRLGSGPVCRPWTTNATATRSGSAAITSRISRRWPAAGRRHLVVWGANRSGSGVQWLTRWPVTAEAAVVVTPGEPDALFVQHHNHLPLARRLATEAEVGWQPSTIAAAIGELERRGAGPDSVAWAGPLGVEQHAALAARFGAPANLNGGLTRLRQIKSAEEIDWLRLGAYFSDLGMAALRDGLLPGLTERELGDLVERAYLRHGAVNGIHYFGVTPMDAPAIAVPAQFPSTRPVRSGDVVFAEITASFWDYGGQGLR